MCVCARALFLCCLFAFWEIFFFVFRFFTSLGIQPLIFEVEEDKEEEENDDEDIIIIIEAAAAVALQKVLDEIVFSCHRRVDGFDVLGCAELRATTRTKTKSDDNDEGGE